MADIRGYWAAVKREMVALPDFPWVMSLDDPSKGMKGGCVSQVSRETAGELLVQKSHRIATEEEIAGFWKRCEDEAKKYAEIERRRAMFNPYFLQQPQTPEPTKGKAK